MKCLIIRTSSTKVDIKTYNMQEIGLAKALIKNGHKCDIIYYAYDGNYKEDIIKIDEKNEIKIYWLDGKKILHNAIFNEKKLIEICNKYDIIQVAEYDQYTSYILNKNKIKPIVIYHGPYFCNFNKKYNLVNKFFDKIFLKRYLQIQPNIITKSLLAKKYLINKGFRNITAIGVGIDKERFNENTSIKKDKTVDNLVAKIKGRKVILYIGQIEKRRNTEFMIKTYKKVYEDNKDTVLLIIGNGKGKYINKCKKLVEKYKLENSVIFQQKLKQEQLTNIYKIASVFLLPTSYEIFGMVLLEAMHFGVPTITTYNGGSSTLIKDGQNGYICDELNEEKWSKKINEIISYDNRNISQNASLRIEEFTWDNLVNKFIEVYEKSIKDFKNVEKKYIKEKVIIFPSKKEKSNRYLNNLYNTVKNKYDVLGHDEVKLLKIFKAQIYHFNWIEGSTKNKYLSIKLDYLKKYIFINILKLLNKKIIWTVHNNFPHEVKSKKDAIKFMKFMAKKSDKIHILCTKTLEEKYLMEYQNKIVYIPHGDYIGNYEGKDIDIFKKYNISNNKKILLFVGQVRKYKNIELLIKAFKNSELEENEYVLLICGKCSDNLYKEELTKIANNVNIYFDFNFIKDNEIGSYLKKSEAIIVPYNKESYLNSGTLWMCMSYSKTMILPLIGCVKDIKNYKDILYTYDYKNEVEHYSALLECLKRIKQDVNKDKDILNKKGKEAYEFILKNQTWEILREKWIDLYKF